MSELTGTIIKSPLGMLHPRWLLLLLFVFGYIFTADVYPEQWEYYLFLNGVAFFSAYLLLWRLKKITAENTIIWIVFTVILVAYFVKYYFFVYGYVLGHDEIAASIVIGGYAIAYSNPELLLTCFTTITYSFCLFSITAIYLLRKRKKPVDTMPVFTTKTFWEEQCYKMILVSAFLAVISGIPYWYFKLGVPRAAVALPFKLAGIITVTAVSVVPALFGLTLIYAIRSYKKQAINLTISIFFLCGITQYLLFGSKLLLVSPLLWTFLIGVWENRSLLNRRYLIIYMGLFIFMYPFLNLIRAVRGMGGADDILLQVSEAFNVGFGSADFTNPLSSMIIGIYGLISRVTGLDSLIILSAIRPLYGDMSGYNILFNGSAERIITSQIVGWRGGTGIAQSLIGEAYFYAGSSLMTAVWVAVWTVFTYQVAAKLQRLNSSFSQVLWVSWIFSVLQWTTDGFIINKLLFFVAAAIPIFLVTKYFEPKGSRFSSGA